MSQSIKIKKVGSDRIYEIEVDKAGENAQPCPDCSSDRKKQKAKSFSYNSSKGAGYCNHCQSRFYEFKPYEKEVLYDLPKFQNKTKLTDKALFYMESRFISSNVLEKMEVCSAEEFMPQTGKVENCICFPFYRNGELVNVKYRDGRKNFKLAKGAELIWYNYDAILTNKEITITEGEMDCLAFMEDGIDNVISVPNGANIGKMSYLDDTIQYFEKMDKIYIAVDNDDKGLELRNEFIRRFGFEKCAIVDFHEYKDANECLMNNGHGILKEFLSRARVPKIDGVLEAEDYLPDIIALWENGMQKGKEIGVKWLDQFITWETRRLAVWSGTPGCFTKNQEVVTSNGVKKISKIVVGDKVLSFNHETNSSEIKSVLATHKFKDREDKLLRIKLKNGTTIEVTENHEFFNGQEYVKIKNILPDDKKTIWKTIPNYNLYQCSNKGEIKTFNWKGSGREAIMKPALDSNGYCRTMLKRDDGKIHTIKVHRIVAQTFIDNPENKPSVNHINGVRNDNRLENLEWCTHSENLCHSYKIGNSSNRGEKNPCAKLTDAQAMEIIENYTFGRKGLKKGELSKVDIAKKYNVPVSVIKRLVQKKTWIHLF